MHPIMVATDVAARGLDIKHVKPGRRSSLEICPDPSPIISPWEFSPNPKFRKRPADWRNILYFYFLERDQSHLHNGTFSSWGRASSGVVLFEVTTALNCFLGVLIPSLYSKRAYKSSTKLFHFLRLFTFLYPFSKKSRFAPIWGNNLLRFPWYYFPNF